MNSKCTMRAGTVKADEDAVFHTRPCRVVRIAVKTAIVGASTQRIKDLQGLRIGHGTRNDNLNRKMRRISRSGGSSDDAKADNEMRILQEDLGSYQYICRLMT